MTNNHNFRSSIVLKKNPLIKKPITVKVLAIWKEDFMDATKPATLEVLAED